jgi:RNA polymerase sigma-70 factor (ECF subfamily)
MSDSTSDKDLITAILSGETNAFAPLVRRHQDHVYGLCLSLMKNPSDAEDAAQDIFLKTYQRLKEFRFESSFSTWLFRVAYHHCLDLLKARSRRPTESLDAIIESRGEFAADTAEGTDPSLWADQARQALDGLRPEDRLVLTLREVQGLTYEEMMESLQISLDAVKSRLRRARESLRTSARHFFSPPVVQTSGDQK